MSVHTSTSSSSAMAVTASYSHLPSEALISRKIVAELTGFSRSTLDRLLKEDRFPAPVIIGRKRRWYYGDVINWLRSLRNNGEGCTNG